MTRRRLEGEAAVATRVEGPALEAHQPPDTELAMEVATSVLYLEAALEDLDPSDPQLTSRTLQLAGRIERVREGGHSEPLEPGWRICIAA